MLLDLQQVWVTDENLVSFLQDFCKVTDSYRAPALDGEALNRFLFQQLVNFAKANKVYIDKLIEQVEKAEKELSTTDEGDKEEAKEETA